MSIHARRPLLIGKNVVQGFSQADFAALGERYTLLMPDVLFFEMLSTPDPHERAQCFWQASAA